MDEFVRRATIFGRVQGVGYRAWAWRQAQALSLRGWVRNLPDGRVELVAAGPEEAVVAFLQACERGPNYARVSRVDTRVCDGANLPAFEVRRG